MCGPAEWTVSVSMTQLAKSLSCVGGKTKCNLHCLDESVTELVFRTYLKVMFITSRNKPT